MTLKHISSFPSMRIQNFLDCECLHAAQIWSERVLVRFNNHFFFIFFAHPVTGESVEGFTPCSQESKLSLTHGYCLVYTSSNSMESFLFIVSWIISSGNTRKLRYLTKISKYLRSGPACVRAHTFTCARTPGKQSQKRPARLRVRSTLCALGHRRLRRPPSSRGCAFWNVRHVVPGTEGRRGCCSPAFSCNWDLPDIAWC